MQVKRIKIRWYDLPGINRNVDLWTKFRNWSLGLEAF
jgi:hypothetical protein